MLSSLLFSVLLYVFCSVLLRPVYVFGLSVLLFSALLCSVLFCCVMLCSVVFCCDTFCSVLLWSVLLCYVITYVMFRDVASVLFRPLSICRLPVLCYVLFCPAMPTLCVHLSCQSVSASVCAFLPVMSVAFCMCPLDLVWCSQNEMGRTEIGRRPSATRGISSTAADSPFQPRIISPSPSFSKDRLISPSSSFIKV